MSAFLYFLRLGLRERRRLALAFLGAIVSAVAFGAGILTIPLILHTMLGDEGKTLPEIAREANLRINNLVPDAWIDLLPQDPFQGVVAVLVGVCVLTVIGASAKFVHSYMAMSISLRTIARVRAMAFDRIIHLPLRTAVSHRTTDQISRIIRDSGALKRGFMALTSKAVTEAFKGAAALGAALLTDVGLTLIALIGAGVLAVIIGQFSKQVKKASRLTLQQNSLLLGTITQAVQALRVVKVHTAEEQEIGRFEQVNDRVLYDELRMRRFQSLASPVVEGFTVLGVALLGGIAAWYVLRFDVDGASMLATLLYLGIAGAAVRPLTQITTDIYESSAAAERLQELLAQEIEAPEQTQNRDRANRPLRALPRHSREIRFEEVSFQYPESERDALADISLSIGAGETVAFVGPNGSGKTTLLSLVPRLFDPDRGRVLVDGIDLQECTLDSIRSQIAVVTQETIVFHDTIAANIAYGSRNGAVSRATIEQVADRALASEFIRRRPGGFDGMLGEQGVTLSGGERQRLALARAMLRDPRILILDEATSMIDAESEAELTQRLREFSAGRTTLVIAHRLATVVDADRIVVMEGGRIIEVGPHRDLVARCPLYQQLCRTQFVTEDSTRTADAVSSSA